MQAFKLDPTTAAEDPTHIFGRRPADDEALRFAQWLGASRPNLSMLRAAVLNAGYRLAPSPTLSLIREGGA